MEIFVNHVSIMRTNCYTLVNGKSAIIIDPGASAEKLFGFLQQNGLKLEAILLTHAHFDHIGGVAALKRLAGEDALVFLHAAEKDFICSEKNLAAAMRRTVEPFVPDVLLKGGERLKIAGLDVKVMHTPGHSPGGVCYDFGDVLFSGDTLFRMTYGRTDLYDSDFAALKNSILNKIFRIETERRVLAGHGDETTLSFEKRNNPINLKDEA